MSIKNYRIYSNLFIGFCAFLQVGVKTIVVYINKADAVNDPEMLELVCIRMSMDALLTSY